MGAFDIHPQAPYIILCKRRIRDSEMSLVFSLLLILQKRWIKYLIV